VAADVVLRATQLSKRYGPVVAVEDVSLEVRRGEVFGFLGPNGAGKTTTISMLLGLTPPTAGSAEVLGQPVGPQRTAALRRVGALVGAPALWPTFSAWENVHLMAGLDPGTPARRIDEVLERVGLQAVARRAVRGFSTGMRQRVALAMALVSQPALLVLDEPATGLDPAGMHDLRTLFRELAEEGVAVFLSSHLLHEVEQTCNRVAVVHRGRIVAQGALAELTGGPARVAVVTAEPQRTVEALGRLPGARDIHLAGGDGGRAGDGVRIEVAGVTGEAVIRQLVAEGVAPREVAALSPGLEAIFLNLTRPDAAVPATSAAGR